MKRLLFPADPRPNMNPTHKSLSPASFLKIAAPALFMASVLLTCSLSAETQSSPATPIQKEEKFITDLLARMTPEEKLGQLNQYTGSWAITGPSIEQGGEEQIKAGLVGSYLNIWGAETTNRLQRMAVEESRLHIPLLFGHDVIHGFRTIFPVPLAETCTWNPDAAQRAAHIAAVEAAATGLHWTFAPMVDVARDARWGRIVEGAGEDPWLGSVFAAARVRGFQGADLRAPDSLLACAKHYVAYGAAEAGRDYNAADISERTLWETYLPPFKAALDAGVGTFMASFNEISGVPATANRHLLTEILRDRWKFDGFVVSDYNGVQELIPHGVAATRADAGMLALNAGVDMEMVSGIYIKELPDMLKSGTLSQAVVDEAVRRVLRIKYRMGLFENPYRQASPEREKAELLSDAHRKAAREIARESLVLLKNEKDTLPLSKNVKTLAVIGPLADDAATVLGSWAGAGRSEEAVSFLAGIKAAVSEDTRVLSVKGCDTDSTDTSGFTNAVLCASAADAVVLVLGENQEMSGEATSRASLVLPGMQEELAKAICATGKPVVVVLTNGRPLAISWLAENASAILEAWQPGTEAGHAVADVLFGDYNPSGKLVVTFPRATGQEPIYYNHKNTGRPPDKENHYTSKYIDTPWTPLYAFGHGLSYTTFTYDSLKTDRTQIGANESLLVTVNVKNTGTRAGEEVAQLYIQDETASVTRPVRELRGFKKILLAPGEMKTISFKLTPEDMAFYNQKMERVVEAGYFRVFAGGSSDKTIETRFEVTATYPTSEGGMH